MKEIESHLKEGNSQNEYFNEITDVLNIMLTTENKKVIRRGYTYGHYMLFDTEGFAIIRYPGATRGHIVLTKGNIIKEFVFYPEVKEIYKKAVDKAMKIFIGKRLIIPDAKNTTKETS